MITVGEDDFDAGVEYTELRQRAHNAGAVCTFTGLVREFYESGVQGRHNAVQRLHLEHYPGMTERALQDIVEQAGQRWEVLACRVIHRVGELQAGDQIVFVGVAAVHRGAAFAAAEFIMDYLKTRAPFWKKQHTEAGAHWVESRDTDFAAASRWQRGDTESS